MNISVSSFSIFYDMWESRTGLSLPGIILSQNFYLHARIYTYLQTLRVMFASKWKVKKSKQTSILKFNKWIVNS